MPSALSRSYSVPVGLIQQQSVGNLNEQQQQVLIDPKAVGAHRPLSSRRRVSGSLHSHHNQPGSPPDSDESSGSGSSSLFGNNDSMTSLSSLMQQLARHQQQQQQQQNSLSGRGHRKLDRSQSEPVQQQQLQPQVQPTQSNSSRYKTELCRPFEENGTCKYGDKCQFAHGFHELRSLVRHPKYKTELCRTFHTIGFCPYGPRCHFIHNADEARNSSGGSSGSSPPPPTPNNPISSASSKKGRAMFSLAQLAGHNGGSTADSPSPPSSLSESPTSVSHTFFGSSDDFHFPGNPFSPMHQQQQHHQFHFGASSLFPALTTTTTTTGNGGNHNNNNRIKAELDSPSPVGSLASDLDSLSLAGTSPSPPLMAAMDLSRQLRLPIFSRISETLNED